MPGTEVFMKVYPLSHPFPHLAQPCPSGLCTAYSLIARSPSVSALYFAYTVDLITLAKKSRELISSLFYAGREVQKMGEVPPSLRALFSRSLSTQVTGVGTCV